MVVLGVVAVSYERGTPVKGVHHMGYQILELSPSGTRSHTTGHVTMGVCDILPQCFGKISLVLWCFGALVLWCVGALVLCIQPTSWLPVPEIPILHYEMRAF